jgi:hypothetical protein
MRTLAKLKFIFKLRTVLGILAFLLFCIPHPFYLMMGVGALILLYMLDDFRALFWRNITSFADEDRPE